MQTEVLVKAGVAVARGPAVVAEVVASHKARVVSLVAQVVSKRVKMVATGRNSTGNLVEGAVKEDREEASRVAEAKAEEGLLPKGICICICTASPGLHGHSAEFPVSSFSTKDI